MGIDKQKRKNAAKVVAMHAKPLQVSTLSFEVGGILQNLNIKLGESVTFPGMGGKSVAVDFEKFYTELSSFPTVAGDPSRLYYNIKEILDAVQPYTLATLRAEDSKLALNGTFYYPMLQEFDFT